MTRRRRGDDRGRNDNATMRGGRNEDATTMRGRRHAERGTTRRHDDDAMTTPTRRPPALPPASPASSPPPVQSLQPLPPASPSSLSLQPLQPPYSPCPPVARSQPLQPSGPILAEAQVPLTACKCCLHSSALTFGVFSPFVPSLPHMFPQRHEMCHQFHRSPPQHGAATTANDVATRMRTGMRA